MKTELSKITRLLITDLMGEPYKLDPVTVVLEDFSPSKGRIIIECYGKSWSAGWGAMSGRTVAQFVSDCGADYIISSLCRVSQQRFSPTEAVKLARKVVCDRRRGRGLYWEYGAPLEREEARELYDDAKDLQGIESPSMAFLFDSLLTRIFGPEWWHSLDQADEPNPSYLYLQRVVLAVQQGLRMAGLAVRKGEVAHG